MGSGPALRTASGPHPSLERWPPSPPSWLDWAPGDDQKNTMRNYFYLFLLVYVKIVLLLGRNMLFVIINVRFYFIFETKSNKNIDKSVIKKCIKKNKKLLISFDRNFFFLKQ